MQKRKYSEKDKEIYRKYADAHARKSNLLFDCIFAFLIGGTICTIGQGICDIYKFLSIPENEAKIYASCTLIILSCILTGLGIYGKIAKLAGAGTLVPITGFANAVSSCAIESKTEGFVLGVGAKMFTIAGPVIVYGTVASVIYGLIYWITSLF